MEIVLATGFFAAALLTYVFMRVILRVGILDVPNERSSHTQPTPRGGGLAIVITFIAFLTANSWFGFIPVESSVTTALIIGGVLIAAIGVADDLRGISARWRFLIHLVAVIVSLRMLQTLPEIQFLGFELESRYVSFVLLSLSLVWFINLFNFMDGIDGIAGVEVICALAGGALILITKGAHDWSLILGFLGASTAGFLIWNWPPARVFMGDACSGFLGFTLGMLAIASSADGIINVWSWLILFGIFVVDATTTLVTRILRGERWLEAHRSHTYQILARRFNSHGKVSVGVVLINAVWLLPFAVLATEYPYWAAVICCVALSPLLFIAIRVGAGIRM
jgi:glycosyltransferase WbpL